MKICRVCLGDSDLSDIFGTDDENIDSNIMLFASVQVLEGDSFPQYICKLCKVELDICVSFKSKCELSYTTLQNKIDSNCVIPDPKKLAGKIKPNKSSLQEETLHSCTQCGLQFSSINMYNMHVEKYKYTCSICNLHFEYKKAFCQHLKSDHNVVASPEKLRQCELCGKSFQYNVELTRHMIVHSGVKQFECNQCQKKFSSKGGLNKHIVKHNGIRKFHCSVCSKTFIHQSNLYEHMKVHVEEKKYGCHICTKSFRAKRTLILHIKIHSNERDFPCSECEKAFTNKFDLLRHAKLHSIKKGSEEQTNDIVKKKKSRNRQCELCGKFCRSLSDLQKHIRVHTGESPYSCTYCEKTFKNSSSLNCHIRIHTQDKPHICKYCGKGFVQSSNLHTHEMIHSPVKPHSCTACGGTFNRKRDLLRHVEKCLKNNVFCKKDSELNV